MTRWGRVCLGTLLLTLTLFDASAADRKRVLMVFREASDVPANRMLEQALRDKLQTPGASDVEIYTEYLDANRFADQSHYRLFREYLREKYAARPPDVVLMVLTPDFDLAGARPAALLPGVPVVFVAVNSADLPGQSLGTNVTGIVARPDVRGTLDVMFRTRPETRRVVVIGGVGSMDRMALASARKASQAFVGRAQFEFWTNQPVSTLRQAVAALPAGCAVLYTSIFRDAANQSFFPAEALKLILEHASVPAYVYADSQIGSGGVGGSVVRYEDLGAWAGDTARRILHGGPVPPIRVRTNGTPVFDWRALQRWGISESRLPAGSVVQFHQSGFWERYRWLIAGTVSLCLFQAALIFGLLVNRAQRLRGEAEATLVADISSKFVHLPASAVDREILDAQRRICEFLGLDLSALWQWSMETPRIVTMTHLYRPLGGPPLPEPMYAHEHFPWCQQQLEAGRMVLVSSLDEVPAEAARDQEVWRHLGIKSIVTFPLCPGGGPVIGALSFNTMRQERTWPEPLLGRLGLVAQIFTNALARKHTDQALRESEERLALATEAAKFGIWVWSLVPNQVWGSENWLRLFGFAAGEEVGFESILQRIHPDDREAVEREVRRAVENQDDYAGEFRAVLPDGTQRWIAARGRGYPDANGTPVRMLGAAIDITERKRTEEALRANEARLAAGTELAGLGYYEVDFGVRACFVDERFEEICGVLAGSYQDLRPLEVWMERLHPDDRQRVLDERQKLQDGRLDRLSIEYRYLHPVAGPKWLQHLGGVATRNASGRAVRTFGVVRDVTGRKQAEAELLRQRVELAHLSRVVMLGELSGSMAHELNQPLTAILSNAQAAQRFLAEDQADLNEVRDILADIVAEDKRAGEIIQRLRLLLKKGEVQNQPLSVNEVVLDVLRLMRSDLVNQDFTAQTELAPDLPVVHGDRVQLQQVLVNLVMNACEAMASAEGDARQFTIRTDRSEDGSVRLAVADCGPGIAPDKLEQIFDSFYTTKPQGMGLGLAVCRTIITAHGGSLWAANNPERGARLCFTLPARGEG